MTKQPNSRLSRFCFLFAILLTVSVLPACTSEKDEQLRDAIKDKGEQLKDVVENGGDELRDKIEQSGEQLKNAIGKDTMDLVAGYTGTIVFKDLEGGFYAFDGEDGTKLMLLNLDASYQQNGLVVEIKGIPAPDIMTTAQYGTPFTISEIRIIDDSQVNQTPQNPTQ